MSVSFVVSEAGCESCAKLVRQALEPLGAVGEVVIDEAADSASVELAGDATEAEVNSALAAVSEGVGHAYRVQPGSWRLLG